MQRLVTRASKLAIRLAGFAHQHAKKIADAARERFRQHLPPDREDLTVYELQMALAEELEEQQRQLADLENLHATQQQRDRRLRQQRQRWLSEVREDIIQLKNILDGYHGSAASSELFKEAPVVPSDPQELYRMTHRVVLTLKSPDFDLPPAQRGVTVEHETLACDLEPKMRSLGRTINALAKSEAETKHTQSLMDAKMVENATLNGMAGRFLEALYPLVGHPLLATRVRLSRHTRSQGEGEAEAGTKADAEVDAKADTKAGAKVDAKADAKAETDTKTDTETDTEPEVAPAADGAPEPDSEPPAETPPTQAGD